MTRPLPPLAIVLGFVDCINRHDHDGLRLLLSDDHRLVVFDEEAVVGRDANAAVWRGYFDAFPRYVIHPRRMAAQAERVAVLGHTTGSHLGLPDDDESRLTLIWVAGTGEGRVTGWQLIEDDPASRQRYGLDAV